MTPAEAARQFASIVAGVRETELVGRKAMGNVVKRHIRETYGDASKLQELAPSTQAERERLGFDANSPLVRTGELLRDSIYVELTSTGFAVGSDEPIAAIQEFGSATIPPRPAIAIGAAAALPEVEELMDATALAILGDRRRLEELSIVQAVSRDQDGSDQ